MLYCYHGNDRTLTDRGPDRDALAQGDEGPRRVSGHVAGGLDRGDRAAFLRGQTAVRRRDDREDPAAQRGLRTRTQRRGRAPPRREDRVARYRVCTSGST